MASIEQKIYFCHAKKEQVLHWALTFSTDFEVFNGVSYSWSCSAIACWIDSNSNILSFCYCLLSRENERNQWQQLSLFHFQALKSTPGMCWDLCSVKSTEKSTLSLNVEMSFGGEPCGPQGTCCLHEALSSDSYPYRLLSDNTKCEPFEKNPMTYQIIVAKTKTVQCSQRWVRCSDAIFLYAQLLLFIFLIISHSHNRFRISPWNQLVAYFYVSNWKWCRAIWGLFWCNNIIQFVDWSRSNKCWMTWCSVRSVTFRFETIVIFIIFTGPLLRFELLNFT